MVFGILQEPLLCTFSMLEYIRKDVNTSFCIYGKIGNLSFIWQEPLLYTLSMLECFRKDVNTKKLEILVIPGRSHYYIHYPC